MKSEVRPPYDSLERKGRSLAGSWVRGLESNSRLGFAETAGTVHRRVAVAIAVALCCAITHAGAHPTGTLVATPNAVAFSYVCPVGDPSHRACVMVWDEEHGVREWVRSEHPASDFVLSTTSDPERLLVLERYHDRADDVSRFRLLAGEPGDSLTEIFGWRTAADRLGDGGIASVPGGFLAAEYPVVAQYVLSGARGLWNPGGALAAGVVREVRRVRNLPDGRLLLLLEEGAALLDHEGNLMERWDALELPAVVTAEPATSRPGSAGTSASAPEGEADTIRVPPAEPLPFGGNVVFDAAVMSEDELVIAYWGARRFEIVRAGDERGTVLLQLEPPWIPHWVAVRGDEVFAVASSLDPGNEIRPRLWRIREGAPELLWEATSPRQDR